MPIYEYEAKLLNGEIRKGKMEAIDEAAVKDSLRSMEYYPIEVKLEGKNNIDLTMLTKVKLKDIALFCRQFSYILVSGMNIVKALEILKDETENKRLKKAIGMLYESVQKGKSLSTAMDSQDVFPEMLVNMVAVGEASGNLDGIMVKMADYYDKEYDQQQKVKKALTYPVMVCIFAILVVNFLVIFILPNMINTLVENNGKLPLPTKVVMSVSNFMQHFWFVILFVIIAIAALIGVKQRSSNSKGFDKFKLSVPIFGKLILKVATAKFARTVGMLLNSGLPVIDTLEISSRVIGNKFLESQLLECTEDIKKGISISDAIESKKIFSSMFIQMIRIGEESGTLDDVLAKTAQFFDKEAETATAQLTTMIEPIIIVVLAFVVGFIILSIILPMFNMYDAMDNT